MIADSFCGKKDLIFSEATTELHFLNKVLRFSVMNRLLTYVEET